MSFILWAQGLTLKPVPQKAPSIPAKKKKKKTRKFLMFYNSTKTKKSVNCIYSLRYKTSCFVVSILSYCFGDILGTSQCHYQLSFFSWLIKYTSQYQIQYFVYWQAYIVRHSFHCNCCIMFCFTIFPSVFEPDVFSDFS